jgi:hypothetical protein
MFDEINCEMIEIKKDIYKKQNPPLEKISNKTNVMVNISLHSLDFNEKSEKFKAKIGINLQW